MLLTRWQPFSPVWNQLQQLQAEMNRVFDRWGGDGNREFGPSVYPPVNLWEDGDALWLEAELPGMDMKGLEIYVTGNNQFTIKGARKFNAPDKSVLHRQERGEGTFVRVLTLPYPVDADKVDAKLENGILRVKLIKHESARPRKIPVKAE